MMTLLEVENLSITLPTSQGMVELISHVDFVLEKGTSLGIVGESGCGKSLTALAIMGLLPEKTITKGEIRFQGENLLNAKVQRMSAIQGNRIAMIFQEPMTALNPMKTIGVQIAEGLRLHLGMNKKDAEIQTSQLLDNVGMPTTRFPLNRYPHQLSGGQRQRVMIAMAIACQPDILIADEPTTALDVTVQEKILDLIHDITSDFGMSLIMISHDLGIIAQTTENMVVMYAGNAVESGTTVDIFEKMAHPYTHGLFSAMPRHGTNADKRLFSIPGQVPEPHNRPLGCNFMDRCFQAKKDCEQSAPSLQSIQGQHHVSCFYPLSGHNHMS